MQKIIVNGILDICWKIFLAKRSENKIIAPGKYHLPWWHVDFWENCEEALVREFKEEFDLDIQVWDLISTFSYTEGEDHTIGICFSISCNNIPSDIWFDEKETQEVAWVHYDNYGEYVKEGWKNHTLIKKYLEK
jgi:ADP-ribose pyrophosphatase YjhB (NUDIX family)